MDHEDFIARMAGLAGYSDDKRHRPKNIASIETLAQAYLTAHQFQVGDRVVMKKGVNGMHKLPRAGQVCVVLETFDQPARSQSDKHTGSPHYMAPLDLRVAFKDEDGDFAYFLMDSRLFEPAKGGNVVEFRRKTAGE